MESKFYRCLHCGNIVEMVQDAGVNPVCCGQKMELLAPNTLEASNEKHIPVVTVDQDKVQVKVGSAEHPMVENHFIQWIQLNTDKGSQRIYLKPGQAPEALFCLGGQKPKAVYSYCNLHGLWKTEW